MVQKSRITLKNNRLLYFLCAVGIIGFLIRLLGIDYGLPYLSLPDEARIILDTLSMGHRHSLLPERPDYALVYRYFLLFIYAIYYAIGKILHYFSGSLDFALKFFVDPTNIYLISRTLSVICGVAIAIPAYLIGTKTLHNRKIGIFSFIFVIFEFQLVQHSQWALYPIFLCFFNLIAFYFMFQLLNCPSKRNYALSGIFCGTAISVQNHGIFLLPALVLAYFLIYLNRKREFKKEILMRWTLISAGLVILFSLLGNFYWFFIFQKTWVKTSELLGVTQVGFSSQAPFTYNIFSLFWWFINELVRQDLLLGVAMVCSIFYSLFKRKAYDWLYLVFIFSYLYFVSNWGFRYLHDILSILPIMCVFSARMLVETIGEKKRARYAYLLLILMVIPLLSRELIVDNKKTHKDTRIIAKEWIEANIPSGAKIGVDWSVFSVPLESSVPFLLRNPIAKKYYLENLEPVIGKDYARHLAGKKVYDIEELMIWSKEPLWPKEMPQELIKEAEKKIVYRDLYSRFIFKDMQKVINEDKSQYIIISSYAWGIFLPDSKSDKKCLFNPFILDRVGLNYSQADHYIDDKRHGYLFYMVKQGRDFYNSLFEERHEGVRLIKEFRPQDNLGPIILIYKVDKNAG